MIRLCFIFVKRLVRTILLEILPDRIKPLKTFRVAKLTSCDMCTTSILHRLL